MVNGGKVGWNILQVVLVLLAFVVATYVMFTSGVEHNYSYLLYPGGLIFYIVHYWKYREKGWLGDPVPIIPWRVAVILLPLSVISFLVGMGVSYFV